MNVNVSNTGEGALGFVSGNITPPFSPLRQGDGDTIFGEGLFSFESFPYSPFTVQQDSDDDALVTQRHLKTLNEKLDSLIASSTSSSSAAYSEAIVKEMLETLSKEHAANFAKENKVAEDSAPSCKDATRKVDKQITTTQAFMTELRSAVRTDVSNANKVIENVTTTIRTEKEALQ